MLESLFKDIAEIFAKPFIKICIYFNVKPNILSLLGLFVVIGGCYLLYVDKTMAGLLTLFIGLAIDGLDGPLARQTNQISEFGGYLDSMIDRITEMCIWCIFAIKYSTSEFEIFLTFLILTGSFLIPYARSKSEILNIDYKIGFTPRPERVIFAMLYIAFELNSYILLAVSYTHLRAHET